MSGHIGEFITVFGWVVRLQGMEIIRTGAWSELSICWLSGVWLMNEDKLGFSMDRDAGFFPRRSQTVQLLVMKLMLLKDPEPFLSSASEH